MKITDVHYGDFRMPNFKNGDKFYIVLKDEIVGVKIRYGYEHIENSNIYLQGYFSTHGGELGKGRIYIDSNTKNLKLQLLSNTRLFDNTTIYSSLEDVRNNIPCCDTIDLTDLDFVNYAEYINKDWLRDYIIMHYWTYTLNDYMPKRGSIKTNDFILLDNNKACISSGTFPLSEKEKHWASREECQKAIGNYLAALDVRDFDEPAKVEVNISVKVSADASNEEIINAVLKTLHRNRL